MMLQYNVKTGQIMADTPAEMAALVIEMACADSRQVVPAGVRLAPRRGRRSARRGTGLALSKRWKKAQSLAKKRGISKREAFKLVGSSAA